MGSNNSSETALIDEMRGNIVAANLSFSNNQSFIEPNIGYNIQSAKARKPGNLI